MNGLRPTLGVEPKDDYEKAKQDVLQAMISVRNLPQWQQQKLAQELFGAVNIAALLSLLKCY